MKKFLPILVCLLLFGCDYRKDLENNEDLPSEAFFAINNWSAQRAYPYGYVNDKQFFNEFIKVKNSIQSARLSSPNNNKQTNIGRNFFITTKVQKKSVWEDYP